MDWAVVKDTFKPLCYNKYFITAVCFLLWVAFVDDDSVFLRYSLSSKVSALEHEKELLKEEIAQSKRKMDELMSSSEQLEKFAREEYFMKKDDEVIFILK